MSISALFKHNDMIYYVATIGFVVIAMLGVQPQAAGLFAMYFLQGVVMSLVLSTLRWGWYIYFTLVDFVAAFLVLALLPYSGWLMMVAIAMVATGSITALSSQPGGNWFHHHYDVLMTIGTVAQAFGLGAYLIRFIP